MSKEDRDKRRADRKKFKDTAVGIFLKDKAPKILDVIGDVLPDNGVLGIAKNLLGSSPMSEDDKEFAYKLLDMEIEEQKQISIRWQSDNEQDLKLPKLIRPVVLAYTWILLTILVVMDAFGVAIDSLYITVFEVLALAVNSAYFGARTIEKYHSKKYGKS